MIDMTGKKKKELMTSNKNHITGFTKAESIVGL